MREDVRWTYAVCKQILPASRRVNIPVQWTEVAMRHTGDTDPAPREWKLQHDGKILSEEWRVACEEWPVVSEWGRSREWRERTDRFCSVDQGIYGHLTLRNLAVLAGQRGDPVEARRLWRLVLNACPGDPEARARGEAAQGIEVPVARQCRPDALSFKEGGSKEHRRSVPSRVPGHTGREPNMRSHKQAW